MKYFGIIDGINKMFQRCGYSLERERNHTEVNAMSDYTQIDLFNNPDQNQPLPDLIAAGGDSWAAFPLAYHDVDDIRFYAVQDWIRGVAQPADAGKYWDNLKRRAKWSEGETSSWQRSLKYTATDGKKYNRVFATAEGLYLITQRMDTETGIRNKVLAYLAKAGVQLDEMRIDPEKRIEIADQQVTNWRLEGKSESWIQARLQGIVSRKEFTDALHNAILSIEPRDYARATEYVYRGLWDRTAAELRGDLGIKGKGNPREKFGEYALIYTRLAEKLAADRLGTAETVTQAVAMEIVWTTAKFIQAQAQATSQVLGYDLITEKKSIGA